EGQLVATDRGAAVGRVGSSDNAPGMAVPFKLQVHVGHRQRNSRRGVLIHGMRKVSHSGRVVDRRYRHADGGRVGVQLPIAGPVGEAGGAIPVWLGSEGHLIASDRDGAVGGVRRSEEHTSELQSRENIVCSLLLEKKKFTRDTNRL